MKKNDKMEQEKQNWQKTQVYLFTLIEAKISGNVKLSGEIEETLELDASAVYRRINGTTELKPHELCILCSKYNISMDKILNYSFGHDSSFKYLALDSISNDSCMQYLQQLLKMLPGLSSADMEFFFTASDIPFYYFQKYTELLGFKMYDLYNRQGNQFIPYKDFCKQLDQDTIISLYMRISESYMQIPSTEIWCDNTISGILKSLKHYYITGSFENKDIVLFMLQQLSELITEVEKDADSGKRTDRQTLFKLYINTVADVPNNVMLLRNGDKFSCDIRLITANSLFTDDKNICSAAHKEINDLISKSILISGRLRQQRCQFFQNIRDKIEELKSWSLNLKTD
jgi:hypothetical protein